MEIKHDGLSCVDLLVRSQEGAQEAQPPWGRKRANKSLPLGTVPVPSDDVYIDVKPSVQALKDYIKWAGTKRYVIRGGVGIGKTTLITGSKTLLLDSEKCFVSRRGKVLSVKYFCEV